MATINVTAEDIMEGDRGSCYRCPIALAIKRCVLPSTRVLVDRDDIFLGDIHGGKTLSTPDAASQFIADFDDNNGGRPFSFELDIPEGF